MIRATALHGRPRSVTIDVLCSIAPPSMIIVLSPAKSLDYESPLPTERATRPDFLQQSAELIEVLRAKSPADIATLMSISDPLAALNVARYAEWTPDYEAPRGRQAVFAFNGDVYEGGPRAFLGGCARLSRQPPSGAGGGGGIHPYRDAAP